jgi:MipA family protein
MVVLASADSVATNPVTEIHTGEIPKGTVGLGVGWRFGDSPYVGIDHVGSLWHEGDYDVLPFYYYEGDWLFAHGSSAGIHLFNNETFSLDAVLSYRFDRLEADVDEFFHTVEDREQTLESGFAGSVRGDWGKFTLSALGDTMDRHNGYAVDMTYRYEWQADQWTVSPFASLIYHDSDLNNYYYGVSQSEARDDLPGYSADDALFLRAGLNTSYAWSKRMRVFANVSVDQLDNSVRDSPLVDEDYVAQAMVGLAYAFGSTLDEERGFRRNPERGNEWSWRVNYGYTAEESFATVHRGHIKKNEDVDTNLIGLTLGKLLLDGDRADFWGKVSLNRRLEHEYQDDFFEVNAYVMAMGTGYSPWTNRELFRYGFGYGFSYADSVPIVEQVKQENRGENTSHFLNYLEAQVDFPLRNLFGDQSPLGNCYAGLTIVHRSGIFGKVDILGNVAGGSDVLTGHLECKR